MRFVFRILFICSFCGVTSMPAADHGLDGFDAFIKEVMKEWNVPGLAIGIVRSNETIYARGFGYRDVEKRLPVTTNTLFAIGSTTKAFTCTLIGILDDDDKLEWDRPVRRYIPEFRLLDVHSSELTTARDLVTHRTGLPRHDAVWYNNNSISRREIVRRLAHLEGGHTFREKFQYNNLMYVAAGHLIETVTGKTWEENTRERIFIPLGMTNSNFSVRDSQKAADFALPYKEKDDAPARIPFRNIDLVGPAGSINSSIHDMLPWLRLNLNKGKHGGRQIINATTLADIHSPQIAVGATVERAEISQATYCLGWVIAHDRGHRVLLHGGGIDGFTTQVAITPDNGVGIVIFANKNGTDAPAVVLGHALQRVLNLDPIDWRGEALGKRKKGKESDKEAEENKSLTRKSGTTPSHPIGEYAGQFEHEAYGPLQVKMRADKLEATFNGMTAALEHWHYDVFNSMEGASDDFLANHKFNFSTDVDGHIAAVALDLEPAVKPIVFKRQIDPRLSDTNYLARFVGEFDYAGHVLTITLSGAALKLTIPKEPQHELVPRLDGSFAIKDHSHLILEFVTDTEDRVTAVQVQRRSGVVLAPRKT